MPVTAIVFLIAFATGCVLALVRRPVFGLATYIVTLYMDPAGQWWGQTTLPNVRWELVPAVITLIAMLVHRRTTPSPVFRSGAFRGFVIFVVWIIIQFPWALDTDAQGDLLSIWSKFLVVSIMVCGCVDSWKNLRIVLFAHVAGCAYMGLLAHEFYSGGRYQGFGLGSVAEANVAALQLVAGMVAAAPLFLGGSWRIRAVLLPAIVLIANGIVTTESRGGLLSALGAGIAFNIFAPKQFRTPVLVISLLGVFGFLSLTTADYWSRMKTIQYAGEHIAGVDTGGARLEVLKAQWRMFEQHPFGCGHMCTDVLSPQYLAPQYLASGGRRSSHNTFMTMLVDHGIPGGLLYVALLIWLYKKLRVLARQARDLSGFPALISPTLIGVMAAIIIGDLFGEYMALEIRVWFISLIIVFAQLLATESAVAPRGESPVNETLEVQRA
jgi:hypothetical protein